MESIANLHASCIYLVMAEALELLGANVIKNLSEKSYEKKRNASIEIQNHVRALVTAKSSDHIRRILHAINRDLLDSTVASTRKAGLMALTAASVGLETDIAFHLDLLVPPTLAAFSDPDARVRYYACEAILNMILTGRGLLSAYFCDIFDGVCKFYADVDVDVKHAAQQLDKYLKRAVEDNASNFELRQFVHLLCVRIQVRNPYIRQLVLEWFRSLHGLPSYPLLRELPTILGCLFPLLGDSNRDIRHLADSRLTDILSELKKAPAAVSNDSIEGVVDYIAGHCASETSDPFMRLTALVWLIQFLEIKNMLNNTQTTTSTSNSFNNFPGHMNPSNSSNLNDNNNNNINSNTVNSVPLDSQPAINSSNPSFAPLNTQSVPISSRLVETLNALKLAPKILMGVLTCINDPEEELCRIALSAHNKMLKLLLPSDLPEDVIRQAAECMRQLNIDIRLNKNQSSSGSNNKPTALFRSASFNNANSSTREEKTSSIPFPPPIPNSHSNPNIVQLSSMHNSNPFSGLSLRNQPPHSTLPLIRDTTASDSVRNLATFAFQLLNVLLSSLANALPPFLLKEALDESNLIAMTTHNKTFSTESNNNQTNNTQYTSHVDANFNQNSNLNLDFEKRTSLNIPLNPIEADVIKLLLLESVQSRLPSKHHLLVFPQHPPETIVQLLANERIPFVIINSLSLFKNTSAMNSSLSQYISSLQSYSQQLRQYQQQQQIAHKNKNAGALGCANLTIVSNGSIFNAKGDTSPHPLHLQRRDTTDESLSRLLSPSSPRASSPATQLKLDGFFDFPVMPSPPSLSEIIQESHFQINDLVDLRKKLCQIVISGINSGGSTTGAYLPGANSTMSTAVNNNLVNGSAVLGGQRMLSDKDHAILLFQNSFNNNEDLSTSFNNQNNSSIMTTLELGHSEASPSPVVKDPILHTPQAVSTAANSNGGALTLIACLQWLCLLHATYPSLVSNSIACALPALLALVRHAQPRVALAALQVMGQLANQSEALKRDVISCLIVTFKQDRSVLSARGRTVVRHLCSQADPAGIYLLAANLLKKESPGELTEILIDQFAWVLLTAKETLTVRNLLLQESQVKAKLFTELLSAWLFSPSAAVGLCLWTGDYQLAHSILTKYLHKADLGLGFLVRIDQLVHLLEAPCFVRLRMSLAAPVPPPYLVETLSCLLMVLPQASAFSVLQQRLNAASLVANLARGSQFNMNNFNQTQKSSDSNQMATHSDASVSKSSPFEMEILMKLDELLIHCAKPTYSNNNNNQNIMNSSFSQSVHFGIRTEDALNIQDDANSSSVGHGGREGISNSILTNIKNSASRSGPNKQDENNKMNDMSIGEGLGKHLIGSYFFDDLTMMNGDVLSSPSNLPGDGDILKSLELDGDENGKEL